MILSRLAPAQVLVSLRPSLLAVAAEVVGVRVVVAVPAVDKPHIFDKYSTKNLALAGFFVEYSGVAHGRRKKHPDG